MSGTLYWSPDPVGKPLSHGDGKLRDILSTKIGLPYVFQDGDVEYLHGLADAGISGAGEILSLIKKHGAVRVHVEY